MTSRPLCIVSLHIRLPVTTGATLDRSGGLSAAAQCFMTAGTAAMKCGAGIRQAGRRGPMTLPAGLAHLESARSMMTDGAVRPFARGVTGVVEGHAAGARRHVGGRGRGGGRAPAGEAESTPQNG